MSANPRVVLAEVSYSWDGGTWTLPAGMILDVPPGGPLESAIGAGNLGTLSSQALTDASNGAGGATSN